MSFIDISAQTMGFFYAILLGAALALLYDFIKLLHHNLLRSVLAIQLADVLFCILSALITFSFFMLLTGGAIRVYLLLGEGIGFVLWTFLCSAYVQKLLLFLVRIGSKICLFLGKPLQFAAMQAKKIFFWLKKRILRQKTLENQ